MIIVEIKYGIGYGTHTTELEFEDGTPETDIEQEVADHVQERLEWSHQVVTAA